MLLDLSDYDSKKIDVKIKELEIEIKRKEKIIADLEFKKAFFELRVIEKGITKEDFDEQITYFMDSGRKENIEKIYLELTEVTKNNEEIDEYNLALIIPDNIKDSKSWEYSIVSINILNIQMENLQKEILALNEQKLKLMNQLLEMQERKVDEIATERKLRELLHDE